MCRGCCGAARRGHLLSVPNLAPGDAVALHALTVHGSYPFSQSVRRRAYSLRFAAGEAVYFGAVWALPRFCDAALQDGQPLDGDKYPVVFEAG